MNEHEFRTGTGPAFEDSKIAAEAIQADVSLGFDYVEEAMLTLSPGFHGDKVSKPAFVKAVNDAIESLNRLDKVKKSLFYGRDNNLIAEGQNGIGDLPDRIVMLSREDAERFIHGAIGMATEAGEMLEAMRDAINGHDLDAVNVEEEVGDSKWYMAILAKVFGFKWGADEKRNIAKLRGRFPDKFTEYDANNRNLSVERAILEMPTTSEKDVVNALYPNSNYLNEAHLPLNYRTPRIEGERRLDGDAIEQQKPTI